MRSSTGGVGAWIRYGNPLEPGELDFAIAHYRAAILQPWETEAAARLKEARPDMTVLAYRCLSSTRDFEPDSMRASGLSYREARRRGWLARRDNGDLVEWNTYPGHFQARVWDPDYRARWVEEVCQATAETAFDGVMADNDVFDDYYGLDLPLDGIADTAALRAEQLLSIVDFASIGTNDLTQYTMAADRLDGNLASLLNPWQPAVLEMIRTACNGGRATGKPIGVCGEAGGDPLLALVLTGLGVASLSMAPSKVNAVRAALRMHDLATCQQMAAFAVDAPNAKEGRENVLKLVAPAMLDLL